MSLSVTEALAEIGKITGLPRLEFGADRICALTLRDRLRVEIEDHAADRTLRLCAILRDMRDADAFVLFQCLAANRDGAGTPDAILAINPASDELVLTQAVEPQNLDSKRFGQTVEAFFKLALVWLDRAAGLRASAHGAGRQSDAPPGDDGGPLLRL